MFPDGKVEIEGNPAERNDETVRAHGEVGAGIVWRA